MLIVHLHIAIIPGDYVYYSQYHMCIVLRPRYYNMGTICLYCENNLSYKATQSLLRLRPIEKKCVNVRRHMTTTACFYDYNSIYL